MLTAESITRSIHWKRSKERAPIERLVSLKLAIAYQPESLYSLSRQKIIVRDKEHDNIFCKWIGIQVWPYTVIKNLCLLLCNSFNVRSTVTELITFSILCWLGKGETRQFNSKNRMQLLDSNAVVYCSKENWQNYATLYHQHIQTYPEIWMRRLAQYFLGGFHERNNKRN